MWELDHKEGWVPKNWLFQTVVLEKTLESPLDSKEIKPVNLKRNLPWLFIGRTGAEAPKLWPPDVKSSLIGKDPDAEKDWGQEEKGATQDEMVGWYHGLNGHSSGQTPGDCEGQGSLACCSPWGHKESATTEWLNNKNLKVTRRATCLNKVISLKLRHIKKMKKIERYMTKKSKGSLIWKTRGAMENHDAASYFLSLANINRTL